MPRTLWWICYDITEPKRLQRVVKAVEAVGQRVHNSAYLCELDAPELAMLQRETARRVTCKKESSREDDM